MSSSGRFVSSLGAFIALSSTLGACASQFDPAYFEGSKQARRAEPEALIEVATRTSELDSLGSVHAGCTLQSGFRRLDGDALSDVDCSTERLNSALRESAASAGGEVLVGLRCSSRNVGAASRSALLISCSAEVARFSAGAVASQRPLAVPRALPIGTPAPSASEVRRIDEPDASLAFRIQLNFEPLSQNLPHARQLVGAANELSVMPLADHALGDLQARCDERCDERALRRGVLLGASRLGAPDVVAVRCFIGGRGNACVGTLAAPEREE